MLTSFFPNLCKQLGKTFHTSIACSKILSEKAQLMQCQVSARNNKMALGLQSPIAITCMSTWRYGGDLHMPPQACFPNKPKHHTHQKHFKHIKIHTYGIQKQSRLRPVCNAPIGREALAEGRAPKTIHVYSKVHARRPHGAYAKLGDKVLMAVKGEKIKGIVVGLKANQLHGIPRFDSNNVVLIDDNGSPIGNRINVPIPNCIKPILKRNSHAKKADYTKLFAIATKFV